MRTNQRPGIIAIYLFVAGLARGQAPPPPTRIVGAVQDASGAPLSKARVRLVQIPDATSASRPVSVVVQTGPDGLFHAVGLPAGTYQVCAESPDPDLLHDCLWGAEKRVSVTASQTAAVLPIRLAAGVDLYVRVKDPTGKRAELEGGVPGADLLLVVRPQRGTMVPIPQNGKDKDGADHHLLVPGGARLQLTAFSKVFALADEVGAVADKARGHQQTIDIPEKAKQHRVVISVTGVN